jgi:hypothetical protein
VVRPGHIGEREVASATRCLTVQERRARLRQADHRRCARGPMLVASRGNHDYRRLPGRRGPDVESATGTPRHLSSGGSGWLAPVDGNSGPGLRFKALANRSDPAFRCQRLASRASRSSSSQCQDPNRIRRRIRTGPCTAQTAVRLAGSSCSRTCVVLAMLESSPHPGVGGLSRSRPPERWSSACWRACRVL